MKGSKGSDVINVFCHVVWPSKVLGLFPFEQFRGCYYMKKPLLFLSIVVVLFYTAITVYIYFVTPHSSIVKFNKHINLLQTVFMFVVSVVALFRLLTSLGLLNDCLQVLQDVEKILIKLGRRTIYERKCDILWFEVLFLFGIVFCRSLRNALLGYYMFDTILLLTYYTYVLSRMIILVQRYSGVLQICEQLFLSCNEEMSALTNCDKPARIEALLSAHYKLSVVSTSYSALEMPHVLLILATSFIICVSEVYKLFAILLRSIQFQLLAVLIKTSWIGSAFTLIWKTVSSCSSCSDEAKRFNILLYQLVIDNKSEDIYNNRKLQLHVALKQEVVFRACGFFTLDYTLVHSMVAAATTYLVILLQFAGVTAHEHNPLCEVSDQNVTFQLKTPTDQPEGTYFLCKVCN